MHEDIPIEVHQANDYNYRLVANVARPDKTAPIQMVIKINPTGEIETGVQRMGSKEFDKEGTDDDDGPE